ncbi:hypothetical protein EJ03DRAFT_330852 [Teratosphaeria nubilosa]|uniref:Uncharacterized protein n=1 Tax=Teratosphaeria nubilosa TaxID=161662 RepID=A0A6G1KY60_9PEZI|nr:hypothetical protein EJ03DRAFT_330852 [Teratosphaeria nubilosa]
MESHSHDWDKLVEQLALGFEALQEEYHQLFGQHQSLERKLVTARQQYNELAKLCDAGAVTTPPLSLSSAPGPHKRDAAEPTSIAAVLRRRQSHDAAGQVASAIAAAQTLRESGGGAGVKIWSGPAADTDRGSSMMPSIAESPLEQDFTIEGTPSRLACPFASMAGKKLSSHAASVLSRYHTKDSANGNANGNAMSSTPVSSVSRVNGRESYSRRASRRASFIDPIKAEICGLSDHNKPAEEAETPPADSAVKQPVQGPETGDVGVCPIRFLNQHSAEEVASYFEKHKHELPRSHEVCVRRYQSNEAQIKQLDAKYGNLVSMIQGLGAKHQDYLPEEPDPEDAEHETAVEEARSNEKVRKWASHVVADGQVDQNAGGDAEERQQHFERPLRDVRVGESPSRPWGIAVPARFLDAVEGSEPARVGDETDAKGAKCPFGFGEGGAAASPPLLVPSEPAASVDDGRKQSKVAAPAFLAARGTDESARGMVFTGPVFVGYSAEDAIKILRETGLGRK